MPRPRPKRTRAIAADPAKEKTKAASPPPQEQQQSSATPPPITKPAASKPAAPSSDIYDVSDREKEKIAQRVAAKAAGRTTQGPEQSNLNSDQARALDSARQRRDEAMARLDDLSSTSQIQPPSADAEPPRGRPPRLTDVSGLDLDDDLFANLDETLDDTEIIPDSQTGYRSGDTSTISVGMFRRRPRRSSVMGRGDERPGSRGQMTPSISSTINFGNFRRRAREPSVVATSRKQRSVSRGPQASRAASILGDGDDSGPDGESTPLGEARRRTRSRAAAEQREESPVAAQTSRKRKSLESHEDGREKRHAAEPQPEPESEPAAEADVPLQSIEVEVERTPTPPRGRARQRSHDAFSTPTRDDPDMAPPLSSSDSESGTPVAWPALDSLAHRTYHTRRAPTQAAAKTPELLDDDSSELSSPPSLTHSPNYAPAKPPPKKAAPVQQPAKKLTTADLTALLPRRRHKPSKRGPRDSNDPFDLDGSEKEDAVDDNDESTYIDSRAASRRRNNNNSKKVRQPAKSSAAANRQAAKTGGNAGAGPKKRAVRTYGSAAAANEDKENEHVEDEIVVGAGGSDNAEVEDDGAGDAELPVRQPPRMGEELKKAAQKFKEVDQWQLSFEVVTESSSPPPPYAR